MTRVLRVFVGWLVPPPIIAATFLVISDLFYMNRLDPEYISLQDSWEYGDFWFIFLYCCIIAYFLLGIPLLVSSLLRELVCRNQATRLAVAISFGMGIGVLVAWTITESFSQLTPWFLLEAFAHCFACIAITVLVSVAIDYSRTFPRGSL